MRLYIVRTKDSGFFYPGVEIEIAGIDFGFWFVYPEFEPDEVLFDFVQRMQVMVEFFGIGFSEAPFQIFVRFQDTVDESLVGAEPSDVVFLQFRVGVKKGVVDLLHIVDRWDGAPEAVVGQGPRATTGAEPGLIAEDETGIAGLLSVDQRGDLVERRAAHCVVDLTASEK